MKKVKNIYYAETKEERQKIGGFYTTGLVLELEDGRMFRSQATDPIMAFEEFKPTTKEDVQQQIDRLTRELKDMDSNSARYPSVWDERVDLIQLLKTL